MARIGEVNVAPGLKPELGHVDGNPITIDRADRIPTLIQNNTNTYKFVPRKLAVEMVKDHKAVILTPEKHGEEYIKATRLALGTFEGFAAGEMIQIGGKAVRVEQIGILDTDKIIKSAEEAVKMADGDSEAMTAALKDPEAFKNKTERERPWQNK